MNIEESEDLARQFMITHYPTFVLVQDSVDRKIDTVIGANASGVKDLFERAKNL